MKKATIAELKNQLSKYLRYVKAGEPVLVVERETPIAHIVPLPKQQGAGAHRLAEMESRGVIRRGDPSRLKKFVFPTSAVATGMVDALVRERRDGR